MQKRNETFEIDYVYTHLQLTVFIHSQITGL